MKSNFKWIAVNNARIHNVQTFLNDKASKAFKKYNGCESTLFQFIGMSEVDYRNINNK
jgi:hypothetical protein